jgi:hypothetical protein
MQFHYIIKSNRILNKIKKISASSRSKIESNRNGFDLTALGLSKNLNGNWQPREEA